MPTSCSLSDLLISHGRHFGQTVFALCNYPSLLTNDSYPGLLDRLKDGSNEEILHVGELIGKGAAGARGDDTKALKSAVLDWISPKGEVIQPPLHRNSKIDRGFNHKLTGSLLCPSGLDWNDSQTKEDLHSGKMLVCGDQWLIFLYAHYVYDHDDPWSSLYKSHLLVCAYKHVFTSPTYIATQVRFTLSSSSVFSQTDTSTDSETFYHSLLDLLEDPGEFKEVDELLTWWNHQIFPTSSATKRPISANSALSKIRQK
ncbi:hypothetical protein BD769DRAFT_1626615 [Suillus cothurnatus]|nr:hypothetical protein BD769DRAFT_1626615 [Suillus cothurnatus]